MFADVNLVCIDSYTMADTRWVKKNAIYSIIRWRNLLYSIYIDVYNKLFGTYVDWCTLGTMEHIAQIKMRGDFFCYCIWKPLPLHWLHHAARFYGIVNSYRKMNLKNIREGNNAKPVQLVF